MRMKPMISRAKDLFSSSRVRALQDKEKNKCVTAQTQLKRLYNTHKRIPYLTESCMVLQMCSMALRITGSLVSSTWCLKAGEQSRTSIQNINVSATTLNNLTTLMNSYLMKTSMMDLQTSTLTLSFWNMSRNGRNRS